MTCGPLTLTQEWLLLTIWQTFRWRTLADVPERTIVPIQALSTVVWPNHWTGNRRWALRTIDLLALADMGAPFNARSMNATRQRLRPNRQRTGLVPSARLISAISRSPSRQ